MLGYGQRTADGRIAWGGRRGPYVVGLTRPALADARRARAAGRLRASARRPVPRARGRQVHPPLGRRARRAPRPPAERRVRPSERVGVGGRLRRCRAWRPPTPPGERSPTSSAASTATSCACRGSGTGGSRGNASRCAGSACTPPPRTPQPPTSSTATGDDRTPKVERTRLQLRRCSGRSARAVPLSGTCPAAWSAVGASWFAAPVSGSLRASCSTNLERSRDSVRDRRGPKPTRLRITPRGALAAVGAPSWCCVPH